MRKLACCVVTSILLPSLAAAANNDIQLWTVVTLEDSIHRDWEVALQARARFDENVSRAGDFLLRPFVTWRPNDSIALKLGYDYLQDIDGRERKENRLWQVVAHRANLPGFVADHRVRIDERFVDGTSGVVVRLRYRLRATRALGERWYVAASDEVMVNANDRASGPVHGFEQNRIRAAFGWRRGRARIEAGYEWQYARARDGPSEHRHVFLLDLRVDRKHWILGH